MQTHLLYSSFPKLVCSMQYDDVGIFNLQIDMCLQASPN